MIQHAHVRFAALVLIAAALAWALCIEGALLFSLVNDGSLSDDAGLLLLFALPVLFAALALAGALVRTPAMLWTGTLCYLLSIMEPGLMGFLYIPADIAIVFGAIQISSCWKPAAWPDWETLSSHVTRHSRLF